MSDATYERESFAAVLLPQGEHRFYQLAMPSAILAECSFVSSRNEDPEVGFQRLLDKSRAQQIANYLDSGLGTIPTSIILSAQQAANFEYDSKTKTVRFDKHPHAFLILDGQHRVYAFRLAEQSMRVPVVIYNSLSRRDEVRLFVDINSKQRGVPNELLLDIKSLAEYENTEEEHFRKIFDLFETDYNSPLFGRLSASQKATNKITRVTFNSALKSISSILNSKEPSEIYEILGNYLHAFCSGLRALEGHDNKVSQSVPFRAIVGFFATTAAKVKDRYGAEYSIDNFSKILQPVFQTIKIQSFSGSSVSKIKEALEKSLKVDFSL